MKRVKRSLGHFHWLRRRVDPAGGHAPWALQVLELRGDRIAEESFERFGFPLHLRFRVDGKLVAGFATSPTAGRFSRNFVRISPGTECRRGRCSSPWTPR